MKTFRLYKQQNDGKQKLAEGPWANNSVAGTIIGGWQVNSVFSAVTGTPFTVGTSGSSLNAQGSSQVADQVMDTVAKLGNVGVGVPFYDPNAFRPVTAVRFGNSGRNTLYGPGLVNIDFGQFIHSSLGPASS